jgi:hypothetical protein
VARLRVPAVAATNEECPYPELLPLPPARVGAGPGGVTATMYASWTVVADSYDEAHRLALPTASAAEKNPEFEAVRRDAGKPLSESRAPAPSGSKRDRRWTSRREP